MLGKHESQPHAVYKQSGSDLASFVLVVKKTRVLSERRMQFLATAWRRCASGQKVKNKTDLICLNFVEVWKHLLGCTFELLHESVLTFDML